MQQSGIWMMLINIYFIIALEWIMQMIISYNILLCSAYGVPSTPSTGCSHKIQKEKLNIEKIK